MTLIKTSLFSYECIATQEMELNEERLVLLAFENLMYLTVSTQSCTNNLAMHIVFSSILVVHTTDQNICFLYFC